MTKAAYPERVGEQRQFKRYPAYNESGVEWLGKIPAHWEVQQLKAIASVHLSNVDKKSVEGQKPVRLCNYTDVYYNERITADLDFMTATATAEQERRFSLEYHSSHIPRPVVVRKRLEVLGADISYIREGYAEGSRVGHVGRTSEHFHLTWEDATTGKLWLGGVFRRDDVDHWLQHLPTLLDLFQRPLLSKPAP